MLDRTKTSWRDNDATVELRGVVGCLLLWLRGQVCSILSFSYKRFLQTFQFKGQYARSQRPIGRPLTPCMVLSMSLVSPYTTIQAMEPTPLAPFSCLTRCLQCPRRLQVKDQSGRTEHLRDTLNFVRGGGSAFDNNGKITFKSLEPDTKDYINAIASIYRELRWYGKPAKGKGQWDDTKGVSEGANKDIPSWDSANLWANNSRIWIDIPWI